MVQIHKRLNLGCCAWPTSCSFWSLIASEVIEAEVAHRKFWLILMYTTTPIVLSICLVHFENQYTYRFHCMGYFLFFLQHYSHGGRWGQSSTQKNLLNFDAQYYSYCIISLSHNFLKINGSNSYTLRLCMGYFLYCSLIASEVVEAGVARRKFCLGCFFFFYHCIVFLHSSRLLRSLDTR